MLAVDVAQPPLSPVSFSLNIIILIYSCFIILFLSDYVMYSPMVGCASSLLGTGSESSVFEE